MKLELFDNTMGFRPKGTMLKFWVMLPQVSTSIGDKRIPPLYGNLKSMIFPYVMVFLTLVLDAILIWQLDNHGVDIMILVALSIVDFIIPLLPIVIFYKKD